MKISGPQLKTYWHNSAARLVKGGKEYFDTVAALIDKAEYEIHFQTYIYNDDSTGQRIAEALKRAAARGVKVYLVVDGYGSSLPDSFAAEMKLHRIYFRRFSPLLSRQGFQLGRRLHHKPVVIDEREALVTGINIADKYCGTGEPAWLDFAVLIEGPIAKEIASVCRRIESKKIHRGTNTHHAANRLTTHNQELPYVRIRQNDWVRRKSQIRGSYKAAIAGAEKSITIIAAYFIPGLTIRRLIRRAALRGVTVKLLLSETSDVPFIKGAHRFLYGWLLHINIRVFEYRPAILHGKAMVVDNEWVTLGSYNINHLSDYSSIEMNAEILSKEFGASFNSYIESILEKDSIEVTDRMVKHRPFFLHWVDWLSYQLVRLNMFLLFFFITKRGKNRLE